MVRKLIAVLIVLVGVSPAVAGYAPTIDYDGEPVEPDVAQQISIESNVSVYLYSEGDHDAKGRFSVYNGANRTYVVKATVVPVTDDGYSHSSQSAKISVTVPPHATEIVIKKWRDASNIEESYTGFDIQNVWVCNQAAIGTDCVGREQ